MGRKRLMVYQKTPRGQSSLTGWSASALRGRVVSNPSCGYWFCKRHRSSSISVQQGYQVSSVIAPFYQSRVRQRGFLLLSLGPGFPTLMAAQSLKTQRKRRSGAMAKRFSSSFPPDKIVEEQLLNWDVFECSGDHQLNLQFKESSLKKLWTQTKVEKL